MPLPRASRAQVPPSLRSELLLFLNQRGLRSVPFLRELSDATVAAIAQALVTSVFTAGDSIVAGGDAVSSLHLVARGRVLQLASAARPACSQPRALTRQPTGSLAPRVGSARGGSARGGEGGAGGGGAHERKAEVRLTYLEGTCFCEAALFLPARAKATHCFVADTYAAWPPRHPRHTPRPRYRALARGHAPSSLRPARAVARRPLRRYAEVQRLAKRDFDQV